MEICYSKDGITMRYLLDKRHKLQDDTYPVKVRVRYKRERLDFGTGKCMTIEEWDRLPFSRQTNIVSIRKDIENTFDLVKKAVEDLAFSGNFTLSRLKTRLKSGSCTTIIEAIKKKVEEQNSVGRVGNAKNYQRIQRNIERFAGSRVLFEDITPLWLRRYEEFLRNEGKKQTTIAIEMRTLRAVFNDAIRNLIIKESAYPFGRGKYEIQEGEGRKLALSLEDIGKIAHYTTEFEAKRKFRDYWMFLYLCNGLNVVDFCKLRYSDIIDGEIRYQRHKTQRTVKKQREIRVVLTDEMKSIISKYGNTSKNGYIFPILNERDSPERMRLKTQYTTKAINKHLSEISNELGIPHVSSYTARHSFATVLKRAGVSIAYISESLGHSSLKTTEHYLASFEREEREKNARLLTKF